MSEADYLHSVLIILAAAIVFVLIFQHLKIGQVIGYLVAGIVIGPFGIGLIQEPDTIHIFAEFGVVFLLFSVGLELPLERILSMRWYIFGLGLLQVFLTSLVIGIIAYLLGMTPQGAIVVGGALALSSTAVVIQILIERNEIAARFGRIIVAILLFQDLAVIPLLTILPHLTGEGVNIISALSIAGIKALVALTSIIIIGRYIIRPLFHAMAAAKNAELFAATTLFIVLSTSWFSAQAGLSMALGAFLAGIMLAETEYRHQVEADIKPYKGLFLGLFFITIGMSLNINVIIQNLMLIIGIVLGLLVLKTVLLAVLCRLFLIQTANTIRVSLMLNQCGEFAFVILSIATLKEIITPEISNILIVAVGLSMITPQFFAYFSKIISNFFEKRSHTKNINVEKEADDLSGHIIVAGFGRTGQLISKLLSKFGIQYVAIDNDPGLVKQARNTNMPVYYGDVSHVGVYKAVGAERAMAIILTIDNPKEAEHAVSLLHGHFPNIKIFVRGHDERNVKELEKLGANVAIMEALEPSLQLGSTLLKYIGKTAREVDLVVDEFRHKKLNFLD